MASTKQFLVRIDLTKAVIRKEELGESVTKFIGGRGVGFALLRDTVSPATDPLSEDNPLVFGTGPLTGTASPSSGRLTLVTKNAMNNGICFSNAGGGFAPALKYAGIDHLMVTGKAPHPTYIFIDGDTVELRGAERLWGLDTWETDSAIKKELEDDRIQILSIGPSGESRSLVACIIVNNGRALGFGGAGAVMGAKNLKAIVVRGNATLKAFDSERFMSKVFEVFKKIDRSIGTGFLRDGGTIAKIGPNLPLPVRNYQDENWSNGKQVTGASFNKVGSMSRRACFNCPMYCSHFYYVTEGKYKGLKCEGTQINVVRGLGSLWDIPNPAFILKAGSLANRYGIHVDELGATLAWAAECYEQGIISASELGADLTWGNEEAFLSMIENIAYRRGFGSVLADGVFRAARKLGKGSETYAMAIKMTGINEGGVRGKKAWAFGIGTNTRGRGHLSGSQNTEGFKSNTKTVGEARYGVPEAGTSTTYRGKARLVYWFERFKASVDCLGICYFTTYWQNNLMNAADCAELVTAFTGDRITEEDLFAVGAEILDGERRFNFENAGFTRKDDRFPWRFEQEPVKTGPYEGETLNPGNWDEMLDEYYALHGWDKNGIPASNEGRREK